jgi:outer membrane protein TolC
LQGGALPSLPAFRSACRPACWASARTWHPAWPTCGLQRADRRGRGRLLSGAVPDRQLRLCLGKPAQLAQGSARQFSIGPLALSLPIFDAGRNRANLKLAQARYDEAVANHEARLLTALREVEDALSDVQQRQQQGDVQAQAQQAAARALLVAQARYDRGVSTYLDVTDAQRSTLAADRAAAQIRTQRLLAAVSVARALGGAARACRAHGAHCAPTAGASARPPRRP